MKSLSVESKSNNRQSNFEILRIISMLMIILFHLSSTRAVDEEYWFNSAVYAKYIALLFEPGGFIGVSIFFMLSGYFLVNKTFSFKRIANIFFTVLVYGVINIFCYILLKFTPPLHKYIANKSILICILESIFQPLSSKKYWFITVYFIIYLCSPLLNSFFLKLNKKGFFTFLILWWIFWYTLPCTFHYRFNEIQRGFFFYILGAYLKLFPTPKEADKRRICLHFFYLTIFVILWFAHSYFEYLSIKFSLRDFSRAKLYSLITDGTIKAFFIPLCSITIFLFFKNLHIAYHPFINMISKTTLAVYLIHGGNYIFVPFRLIFKNLNDYTLPYFALYAILGSICCFAYCTIIELIRIKCTSQIFARINKMLTSFYNNAFLKEEEQHKCSSDSCF